MLFAGLWDVVTLEGETEPLYTFTIITTSAAKKYEWLHDRQPVILHNQRDVDVWLADVPWGKEHVRIMQPYSGPELDVYALSC
jgi:putative SOS response-associated peptidase YedK